MGQTQPCANESRGPEQDKEKWESTLETSDHGHGLGHSCNKSNFQQIVRARHFCADTDTSRRASHRKPSLPNCIQCGPLSHVFYIDGRHKQVAFIAAGQSQRAVCLREQSLGLCRDVEATFRHLDKVDRPMVYHRVGPLGLGVDSGNVWWVHGLQGASLVL